MASCPSCGFPIALRSNTSTAFCPNCAATSDVNVGFNPVTVQASDLALLGLTAFIFGVVMGPAFVQLGNYFARRMERAVG